MGDVEVMVDVAIKNLPESCVGVCTAHSNPIPMTGMITVGSGNLTAYGSEVCLVGATVTGNCGHTGTITSGASKTSKGGVPLAIVGSSFSGNFSGTVVLGQSKMQVV